MKTITEILGRWSPPGSPPLKPAAGYDIDDLEETVGAPLPGAYRAFLETMGESVGALRIDKADFSLERVREVYAIASWSPPPRLVRAGVDLDPMTPQSFYLDRERPSGEDDCAVVRFLYSDHDRWEERAFISHASLRELLLYWGFQSLRAPGLRFRTAMSFPYPAPQELEPTRKVLESVEKLGMPRVPVAEVARIYDGEGGGILVDRHPLTLHLRTVHLGCDDEREQKNRVAMLESLGLRASPHP